jgi:Periplasmic protease
MHKKISVGITASLILIAITVTFTATMIFSMNMFDSMVTTSSQRREAVYEKMLEIDKIVRQYYYEEIDETELYSSLINGYVAGLGDPDSVFLTAEQIAYRDQQARGVFVSVGIEVSKDEFGYCIITKVYPESPAAKGEMSQGDTIIKIGDQEVASLDIEEVRNLLTGIEGESVTIEYLQDDTAKNIELKFETVESTAVESSHINDVYYIRVWSLWDTAPEQFSKALRDATNTYNNGDANGLIIDLRDVDNGHNLRVVADMLDMMLPTGTLLSGVYKDDTKVLYTSDANSVDIPVVLLINANTKGYAEAFAAVMKDSDICIDVVGVTTYGKGTLQQLIKLTDGSGVDISVALLKPPKSGTFHETGVIPISEYRAPDDFVLVNNPTESTDGQFAKAVEILRSYSR